MKRRFAIGDVHGCNRTLNRLLERMALLPGDTVIFLGDYIDRGPDSRGVIDTIFDLQKRGIDTICLRGNHEQLMLYGLQDVELLERWLINGGMEALESFGARHPSGIPEQYMQFFRETLICYETGRFICVHGGINTRSADLLSDPSVLLWTRYWYPNIDYRLLGNRIVLHGHTPEEIGKIQEQYQHIEKWQYLNLDNGCVYGRRPQSVENGLGCLLAYGLDTGELLQEPYGE